MSTSPKISIVNLKDCQSLSVEQMQQIYGGEEFKSRIRFDCRCLEGANSPYRDHWSGYYISTIEISIDLETMCWQGHGKCIQTS